MVKILDFGSEDDCSNQSLTSRLQGQKIFLPKGGSTTGTTFIKPDAGF
mgnify:CR=1 FL=1